jgi:hypothetical protein
MPKLFAEFHVQLPGQCLYAFPDETEIIYSIPLDDFLVKMTLQMPKGSLNRGRHDSNWIGTLHSIRVLVSREEAEFPPLVTREVDGTRDYSIQSDYFWVRIPQYASAAREITNRMIRYFRFVLGVPHLEEFQEGQQAFSNATWKNEAGEIVGKGPAVVVFSSIPGSRGQMHVSCLSESNRSDLEKYLSEPEEISLADQMIDNARCAWFDGNLQRTVLELAIVCEMIVKRRFFSHDSAAGAAFDYLEDKGMAKVSVKELINGVARAAFGTSFNAAHKSDYRNIDHLFRCRNKIAHRGELSFQDDAANRITPDKNLIDEWFNSVLKLKTWLVTLG